MKTIAVVAAVASAQACTTAAAANGLGSIAHATVATLGDRPQPAYCDGTGVGGIVGVVVSATAPAIGHCNMSSAGVATATSALATTGFAETAAASACTATMAAVATAGGTALTAGAHCSQATGVAIAATVAAVADTTAAAAGFTTVIGTGTTLAKCIPANLCTAAGSAGFPCVRGILSGAGTAETGATKLTATGFCKADKSCSPLLTGTTLAVPADTRGQYCGLLTVAATGATTLTVAATGFQTAADLCDSLIPAASTVALGAACNTDTGAATTALTTKTGLVAAVGSTPANKCVPAPFCSALKKGQPCTSAVTTTASSKAEAVPATGFCAGDAAADAVCLPATSVAGTVHGFCTLGVNVAASGATATAAAAVGKNAALSNTIGYSRALLGVCQALQPIKAVVPALVAGDFCELSTDGTGAITGTVSAGIITAVGSDNVLKCVPLHATTLAHGNFCQLNSAANAASLAADFTAEGANLGVATTAVGGGRLCVPVLAAAATAVQGDRCASTTGLAADGAAADGIVQMVAGTAAAPINKCIPVVKAADAAVVAGKACHVGTGVQTDGESGIVVDFGNNKRCVPNVCRSGIPHLRSTALTITAPAATTLCQVGEATKVGAAPSTGYCDGVAGSDPAAPTAATGICVAFTECQKPGVLTTTACTSAAARAIAGFAGIVDGFCSNATGAVAVHAATCTAVAAANDTVCKGITRVAGNSLQATNGAVVANVTGCKVESTTDALDGVCLESVAAGALLSQGKCYKNTKAVQVCTAAHVADAAGQLCSATAGGAPTGWCKNNTATPAAPVCEAFNECQFGGKTDISPCMTSKTGTTVDGICSGNAAAKDNVANRALKCDYKICQLATSTKKTECQVTPSTNTANVTDGFCSNDNTALNTAATCRAFTTCQKGNATLGKPCNADGTAEPAEGAAAWGTCNLTNNGKNNLLGFCIQNVNGVEAAAVTNKALCSSLGTKDTMGLPTGYAVKTAAVAGNASAVPPVADIAAVETCVAFNSCQALDTTVDTQCTSAAGLPGFCKAANTNFQFSANSDAAADRACVAYSNATCQAVGAMKSTWCGGSPAVAASAGPPAVVAKAAVPPTGFCSADNVAGPLRTASCAAFATCQKKDATKATACGTGVTAGLCSHNNTAQGDMPAAENWMGTCIARVGTEVAVCQGKTAGTASTSCATAAALTVNGVTAASALPDGFCTGQAGALNTCAAWTTCQNPDAKMTTPCTIAGVAGYCNNDNKGLAKFDAVCVAEKECQKKEATTDTACARNGLAISTATANANPAIGFCSTNNTASNGSGECDAYTDCQKGGVNTTTACKNGSVNGTCSAANPANTPVSTGKCLDNVEGSTCATAANKSLCTDKAVAGRATGFCSGTTCESFSRCQMGDATMDTECGTGADAGFCSADNMLAWNQASTCTKAATCQAADATTSTPCGAGAAAGFCSSDNAGKLNKAATCMPYENDCQKEDATKGQVVTTEDGEEGFCSDDNTAPNKAATWTKATECQMSTATMATECNEAAGTCSNDNTEADEAAECVANIAADSCATGADGDVCSTSGKKADGYCAAGECAAWTSCQLEGSKFMDACQVVTADDGYCSSDAAFTATCGPKAFFCTALDADCKVAKTTGEGEEAKTEIVDGKCASVADMEERRLQEAEEAAVDEAAVEEAVADLTSAVDDIIAAAGASAFYCSSAAAFGLAAAAAFTARFW